MARSGFAKLVKGLSTRDAGRVSRWWQDLSPAHRRDMERTLDEGRRPARVRLVGRFVMACVPPADPPHPHIDFYEYLVNHEVSLEDKHVSHICSAHPSARAAISSGTIRASFACPLANTECPMRRMLARAPGWDLRLALAGAS